MGRGVFMWQELCTQTKPRWVSYEWVSYKLQESDRFTHLSGRPVEYRVKLSPSSSSSSTRSPGFGGGSQDSTTDRATPIEASIWVLMTSLASTFACNSFLDMVLGKAKVSVFPDFSGPIKSHWIKIHSFSCFVLKREWTVMMAVLFHVLPIAWLYPSGYGWFFAGSRVVGKAFNGCLHSIVKIFYYRRAVLHGSLCFKSIGLREEVYKSSKFTCLV